MQSLVDCDNPGGAPATPAVQIGALDSDLAASQVRSPKDRM